MAGADDLGYINRHGLSRKVSRSFAWGLARPGLTPAPAHLRVGEGQLEEAGRRLHRRFAMSQVRFCPRGCRGFLVTSRLFQRFDPETPIEETVRCFLPVVVKCGF